MKALRSAEEILVDCPYNKSNERRLIFSATELRWCIETAQREALEAAIQSATLKSSHMTQPTDQPYFIFSANERSQSVWVNKQSILNLLNP